MHVRPTGDGLGRLQCHQTAQVEAAAEHEAGRHGRVQGRPHAVSVGRPEGRQPAAHTRTGPRARVDTHFTRHVCVTGRIHDVNTQFTRVFEFGTFRCVRSIHALCVRTVATCVIYRG